MEKDLQKRHLFRLGELKDYKVSDNDPDVRGWDVIDKDNDKIGTISELIVDPDKKIVRYLDIVTIKDLSVEGAPRHLIIPVGAARLDEKEDKVIVNEADKDVLKTIPDYKGGPITLDYEFDVVERLRGERKSYADIDEMYNKNQDLYNQDTFYNPRRDLPLIVGERTGSAYFGTSEENRKTDKNK